MKELGINPTGMFPGETDALHVPFVVVEYRPTIEEYRNNTLLKPGEWVKLKEGNTKEVVRCSKEEAIGMIDPFLDEIDGYDKFVVLLVPGVTTETRHTFEIRPELKKLKREFLEAELEEHKKDDPECASCWQIKNNRIIRM